MTDWSCSEARCKHVFFCDVSSLIRAPASSCDKSQNFETLFREHTTYEFVLGFVTHLGSATFTYQVAHHHVVTDHGGQLEGRTLAGVTCSIIDVDVHRQQEEHRLKVILQDGIMQEILTLGVLQHDNSKTSFCALSIQLHCTDSTL